MCDIMLADRRKKTNMLSTFRKKSPTYKAIAIQGCRNKCGDYLWTDFDDLDEFAKFIHLDWTWDTKHGEVKFWLPGVSNQSRPKFSVMIGYVAISDGTCQHLEILDEEKFRETFEEVEA